MWFGLRFLSSLARLNCSGNRLSTLDGPKSRKTRGARGTPGPGGSGWMLRAFSHPLWTGSLRRVLAGLGVLSPSWLSSIPKGIFIKDHRSVNKIKCQNCSPVHVLLQLPTMTFQLQVATCHPGRWLGDSEPQVVWESAFSSWLWLCHRFS